MKSHTTGETLLCPAFAAFIRTMIGTDAEEEIKKIPLPDVTINRHINNMSVPNNEKKFLKKGIWYICSPNGWVYRHWKVCSTYSIPSVYQRLKIMEQFLFCKELEGTTTGETFLIILMNAYNLLDYHVSCM
jgi:hypothetical protein